MRKWDPENQVLIMEFNIKCRIVRKKIRNYKVFKKFHPVQLLRTINMQNKKINNFKRKEEGR